MKKTILAALAVLLAIMAVTCDSFVPDANKEPPQYTKDGRLLVPLSINAPKMSRALTLDLAKGLVDYYEVAFKDPDFSTTNKIYRTSWNYAKTGRIAVPAGDYTGAAKAVLFAGRYSDKTLYAVGIITTNMVITPTTTSVTFTLSPLLNDVSNNKTTSTFKITGPTVSDPGGYNYSTASITEATIPTVELSGQKLYPIFGIPPAPYDNSGDPETKITATYTVNCGTAGAANANYAGVIVTTEPEPEIVSAGYSDDESKDLPTAVTGTVTAPLAGAAVPSTGIFNLNIDISAATTKNGLSRLSIDIPVCAINNTLNTPGVWHIRGGMNQTLLDEGAVKNGIGGAVLLAVGPVTVNSIVINKVGP